MGCDGNCGCGVPNRRCDECAIDACARSAGDDEDDAYDESNECRGAPTATADGAGLPSCERNCCWCC